MSINLHLGGKKKTQLARAQRFLCCTCNGDGAGQERRKPNALKAKGNRAGDAAGGHAGTKSTKNRETRIKFFPLTIFCGGIASVAMDILMVT